MTTRNRKIALAVALALATPGLASAATIVFNKETVVSTQQPDANNAYKAKMVTQKYKSATTLASYDVDVTLIVYADGPPGEQDIWIARSTDNGATWSQQAISSSAGTPISITQDDVTYDFLATNGKPNIYAPATGAVSSGKGANVLVSWGSSYCLAADGSPSPAQKVNLNLDIGPEPYKCLWEARSTNGGLSWNAKQVTDGSMDVDEDVPAGYTTSTLTGGGFAIVWQADPLGLKQGQAEGPGEGASGASVSQGTNIWYTYLSKAAFESGTAFPAPVQISDNTPENGQGASRPNLAISGGTAVLAYEETKGDSELEGKQIIYHSFGYAVPPMMSSGTAISDPTKNARRVRFMLQGNEALDPLGDKDGDAADGDTAGVHVALLWRQQDVADPTLGSDVMFLRGIKNTTLRPGSTGFLATDLEPYSAAQNLSNRVLLGGADNALAQRGVLRGDKIAIGFDFTRDMTAAAMQMATYDLYIITSLNGGGSWNKPANISKIDDYTTRAVEPRLVGTPGTILLPSGAATGDPKDVQNTNIFWVAYGTETNTAVPVPLDIWATRTDTFGAKYDSKKKLALGDLIEQSETQLKSTPAGNDVTALWMQKYGEATDVYFRSGFALPPTVVK